MDQSRRLTWPDKHLGVTGTIGFLDFDVLDDGLGPYIRLQLMGIEPDYRNAGYAQALLSEAERIAGERGIVVVETSGVRCDNKPMLHIFEKFGYSETHEGVVHRLPWREQGGLEPDWVFDVRFVKFLAGAVRGPVDREYQAA